MTHRPLYRPNTLATSQGCPAEDIVLDTTRGTNEYGAAWAYFLTTRGFPAWSCNRVFFERNFSQVAP